MALCICILSENQLLLHYVVRLNKAKHGTVKFLLFKLRASKLKTF